MNKKIYLSIIIIGVILASAFMIMQSPSNPKSYDDMVDISELIQSDEASHNTPDNVTRIGSFGLWDSSVFNVTRIGSFGLWDSSVLDLNYLMKSADIILIGTVDKIKDSEMTKIDIVTGTVVNTNDSEMTKIKSGDDMDSIIPYAYTDVIINVEEYIKNKPDTNKKKIVVRTAGGCVKDICYENLDEANFKLGEKMFLLLTTEDVYTKDIGEEHYRVVAGSHGKFTITEDKDKNYGVREKVPEGYRVYLLDDLTKLASGSK